MVHVHIPKPLHGWREFIGEVGIIVIGVLIALGAEALIEKWHWHEQGDHTREVIKAELLGTATNSWERLAVSECLRSRLTTVYDALKKTDGAWIGLPSPIKRSTLSDVVTPVYALPSRGYPVDAWKNALSSGVLNHMPRKDVGAFSDIYSMVSTLDDTQRQEAIAAARLAPLSSDQRLDDRARLDMMAAVAEVDRTTALMNIVSEQYLSALQEMRLGFDTKSVQKDRDYILPRQRKARGDCVKALPLDLN